MPSYDLDVGDVIEVIVRQELDAQTVLNTFHYVCTGETDEGAAALYELATTVNETIFSAIQTFQSENILFKGTSAQKIWPTRFIPSLSLDDANPTGSVTTESLPTTVAAVLRRRSFDASKHGRGRIFIAGLPITAVVGSQLTPTVYDEVNSVGVPLIQPITTGGAVEFIPVLYDRNAPGAVIPIQSAVADPILRVQRRREVGVGF